jgi:hypothetical protein
MTLNNKIERVDVEMETFLLPTTKNVDEKMTVVEALEVLKSNHVEFEVSGDVVNGMYLSNNGEIVEEELIPITGNVNAQQLATMFTQECILEYDNKNARLVAQNGEILTNFDRKIEYRTLNNSDAVELQETMSKYFGGASRIDNDVWSWTTESDIKGWIS